MIVSDIKRKGRRIVIVVCVSLVMRRILQSQKKLVPVLLFFLLAAEFYEVVQEGAWVVHILLGNYIYRLQNLSSVSPEIGIFLAVELQYRNAAKYFHQYVFDLSF